MAEFLVPFGLGILCIVIGIFIAPRLVKELRKVK